MGGIHRGGGGGGGGAPIFRTPLKHLLINLMQLVIKRNVKNVCHNLFSRHDLYSRKTYNHASADHMVGKEAPNEKPKLKVLSIF